MIGTVGMGAFAVVVGFLLGSVPFGYLLVRMIRRTDVRQVGSGNIGATNVGRVMGPAGWVATLLLDLGKGAAAVGLAAYITGQTGAALAGGAVVAGHCFTPWLGGRGGKGMATFLGSFAVLSPASVVAGVAAFGLAVALTRMVSVGSLLAALVIPVATWWRGEATVTVAVAVATCALVWARHTSNIGRLLQGTEARIGRTGS